MPKTPKRFYNFFNTTLPDQFVEANYPALCKFCEGWDNPRVYKIHAAIIEGVSIGLCPGKTRWPLLVANSPSQITIWMRKNGDHYNGRYWETLEEDNRCATPRTPIRTSLPSASRRAINTVLGSGLSLIDYMLMMDQQRMHQVFLYGMSPARLALMEEPRPALKRAGIVAGEIIGYRCWRIQEGILRSVYQSDFWFPNQPLEGRELGDWDSRGIHAWKDAASKEYHNYIRSYLNSPENDLLTRARHGYDRLAMVTGTVYLWGDVVEHERGYRAEFARIRSLDWLYPDETMMGREQETLQHLRKMYGVAT